MADKDGIAQQLETARRALYVQVENVVRDHAKNDEPIRIALSLVDTPDAGSERAQAEHPKLYDELMELIGDFMEQQVVKDAGLSITGVEAVDSDGDGSVAVNIGFQYRSERGPDDQGRSAIL